MASRIQEERFVWDFDLPNDPFWHSIGWKPARMFFSCFTEGQITAMNLPYQPAPTLSDKYTLLLHEYSKASTELGTSDLDFERWIKLAMGRSIVLMALGRADEADAVLREMAERPDPSGKPNITALHAMAFRTAELGQYAEAERLALELLPIEEAWPTLGAHSPQALNVLRLLVKARFKQGKTELGRESVERLLRLTEEAKESRFRKYEADEREQNEELMRELGVEG